MSEILSNFAGLFIKLWDGLKLLLAGLFIRRSTIIETERNVLETSNQVKSEQLQISAAPPANPSAVRNRMQDGEF